MLKTKTIDDYKITRTDTSVIFKDNMDEPIHRWFHYTEGFSKDFVLNYFNKYEIDQSKTVYEPFMGSGTVGLCSKLEGINSIGVELNPLMHFISEVKTQFNTFDPTELKNLQKELIFPGKTSLKPPHFLKNDKHFDPDILQEILKIKEGVANLPDIKEKNLIKLSFANILLKSSNAKRVPSFGYKKKKNISTTLPYQLLDASIEMIVEDLIHYKDFPAGNTTIVKGDARNQHFISNSADISITSPPYANGIDYVTDYQLEMAWMDFIDLEKKAEIRDTMIAYDKTRVPILRQFQQNGDFYSEPNLMNVVKELEAMSSNYWKKDIHLVILKYFDDMYKVMKNTYDILKPGSRFILVVGDSLFNNVYVPADLLLGIMGEKIGFEFESIEIARDRYSGQNRSFKLRETIVTLKK